MSSLEKSTKAKLPASKLPATKLPALSQPMVLTPEGGLSRYLRMISTFPMLGAEEELELARRWRNQGDIEAAHMLVNSHLRLVAKIAMGYRGYGLPIAEIISEGNMGLMRAVKKFDPDKGFRLTSYAIWWIKAAIQQYVLHSWSLVKIGTTRAQKKLFFNLRKAKQEIQAFEKGDLRPENLNKIADRLGVEEKEVVSMNRRMTGNDFSLNAPLKDEESSGEWIDWLPDEKESQENLLEDKQEHQHRKALLLKAMDVLDERERDILTQRKLKTPPVTLKILSEKYTMSRERVRQIELRAFKKLRAEIRPEN